MAKSNERCANLRVFEDAYIERLHLTSGINSGYMLSINVAGQINADVAPFVPGNYVASGGIAGGQTINGDTAPSGLLTLHSTAHATKGKIIIGSTSAYDELNGRMGIGTISPLTRLNVAETVNTSPRGILSSQYSSDVYSARIGCNKSRGTVTSPTTIVTGDNIGRLMFRGYEGASYIESSCIEIVSTGTIGTGRVPTEMVFYTGTDVATTVMTEAMRLTVTQNLKILNDHFVTASNYAGSGIINMLKVNTSDQVEVGAALSISGYYELLTNGVAITAMDMPVNDLTTARSYSIKVGGNNAITLGTLITTGALTIGVYGHAPVVQPTSAVFGTWTTLANVVTALQSNGTLGT